MRILYVEAHGSGSHARIASLLQRFSRHALDIVLLSPDHWRWLALTAHRSVADALRAVDLPQPDAIILSGPLDVAKLLATLPREWRESPRAIYFHESQWTYPGTEFDRRPYLVGHLETLEACDRVWFNSRYHRDVFQREALSNRLSRVQRLAGEIIPAHWYKTRVVYPPVQVCPATRNVDGKFRIVWAARWEREKRPDLLVEAIEQCVASGLEPAIHVLGAGNFAEWDKDTAVHRLRPYLADPSGYMARSEYEETLARAGAWVSTAEQEYFGVAALEAALCGVTPVLPYSLAYPETLPSAIFYPPGDVNALVDRLVGLSRRRPGQLRPWTIDALRFEAAAAAAVFDTNCAELLAARSERA
jgi:glycosyltransferase involved in cell wall biosynthesis